MTSNRDDQIRDAIGARATEWFVRHRAGDMTPEEERGFMQWLKMSPQHVGAYLELVDLFGKLGAAIEGLRIDKGALYEKARSSAREESVVVAFSGVRESHAPPPKSAARERFNGFRLWVAAALVLVAASALWIRQTDWPEVFSAFESAQNITVPHGEQRALQLVDGSVVRLNSDARMTVRYTKARRTIELNEGQALFEVFHDASRPFVVRVGAADIVAVGTKFEVFRKSAGTTVTVVEGKIKLLERATTPGEPPTLNLTAGQQVRLAPDVARKPTIVNTQLTTAWVRREVAFVGQPLGEVANEFNRYISTPIVIEDPALREYRISGVFQTYDLDSFIAYLRQFDSIEVERTAKVIRVKPRPPSVPVSVVAGQRAEPNGEQRR